MADPALTPDEITAEIRRRQQARSRILGFVLGGLALLFYLVTFLKFPTP